MKRLLHRARVLFGLLLLGLPFPGPAYDYEGHRLACQLALDALPEGFPAFVREPAARERAAYLAGEPDRWRNTDELALRHASYPDHYFDFEDLEPMGARPGELTPFRYLFAAQVMAAREAHPERFPPIDANRNSDRTREWPGFLPWTITEQYARLESAFATLRAFIDGQGTAGEIAHARASVVENMGLMAHFVADGSQPLHTTRHYNGWTGANPDGFTTNRSFHAWIDGGFFEKVGLPSREALQPRMRPARALWNRSSGSGSPVFARVVAYLEEQHREVRPLYQLEKDRKLTADPAQAAEGREYLGARLVAGAQFLADLWLTAHEQAPQDVFLRSVLARRQLSTHSPAAAPRP